MSATQDETQDQQTDQAFHNFSGTLTLSLPCNIAAGLGRGRSPALQEPAEPLVTIILVFW